MLELREYQRDAIHATRSALLRSKNAVILCAPTGAGKTVLASEMVRLALARGHRCLLIVHRIELLTQARDKLAALGIESGIIKAGYDEDRSLRVQVASIQTLGRRELPEADLVLVDECHHAMAATWERVIAEYRSSGAWVLGLSATPMRLDGRGLGALFNEIIEPVSTLDLIEQGYLVDPVVYAPSTVDMTGVRKSMGDYAMPETVERISKLTGSIVDCWEKYAGGAPTLCFASSIEHSRAIVDAFGALRALHVDGGSSVAEREHAVRSIADGSVSIVSQVGLWGEGFDAPNLGALIVARPTLSLAMHKQMVGRIMRTHPGKTTAIVLDHAGNTQRHGFASDPVEWSLEDRPTRPGVEPISTCAVCYALFPAALSVCPACGAEKPDPVAATVADVVNPGVLKRLRRKKKEDERDTYRSMLLHASEHGWKLGAARHEFKDRFGKWPRLFKLERECFVCPEHVWVQGKWGVSCQICRRSRSN